MADVMGTIGFLGAGSMVELATGLEQESVSQTDLVLFEEALRAGSIKDGDLFSALEAHTLFQNDPRSRAKMRQTIAKLLRDPKRQSYLATAQFHLGHISLFAPKEEVMAQVEAAYAQRNGSSGMQSLAAPEGVGSQYAHQGYGYRSEKLRRKMVFSSGDRVKRIFRSLELYKESVQNSASRLAKRVLDTDDPKIALRGLGAISTLKGLEIGCENVDMSEALALLGIQHYDLNSVEPITLLPVVHMLHQAGIRSNPIVGDIQTVYFETDYDFFIARDMVFAFQKMSDDVFVRLVHGKVMSSF